MNVANKIIHAGLLGLLAASALMVGYAQAEAEAPPQVQVVRGEGTGVIADVGIVSAAMFEFDSWKLKEEGKAALEAYSKETRPRVYQSL
jgi:hypothetical protein